jgi:hypothetical protein
MKKLILGELYYLVDPDSSVEPDGRVFDVKLEHVSEYVDAVHQSAGKTPRLAQASREQITLWFLRLLDTDAYRDIEEEVAQNPGLYPNHPYLTVPGREYRALQEMTEFEQLYVRLPDYVAKEWSNRRQLIEPGWSLMDVCFSEVVKGPGLFGPKHKTLFTKAIPQFTDFPETGWRKAPMGWNDIPGRIAAIYNTFWPEQCWPGDARSPGFPNKDARVQDVVSDALKEGGAQLFRAWTRDSKKMVWIYYDPEFAGDKLIEVESLSYSKELGLHVAD